MFTRRTNSIGFFNTLTKGHQNYFSKWINAAKTIETQTKRIAMIIHALNNHWDYGSMIRNNAKINKQQSLAITFAV